jgi:transitional endoplasmic reticulum ATPase
MRHEAKRGQRKPSRAEGKVLCFLKRKKLGYLLNAIRRSRSLDEEALNLALGYLPEEERRTLLDETCSEDEKDGQGGTTQRWHPLPAGNPSSQAALRGRIARRLEALAKSPAGATGKSELEKRLREIQRTFRLTEDETEILLMLYLREMDLEFETMYQEICKEYSLKSDHWTGVRIQPLAVLSGIPVSRINDTFSETSTLIRTGLLEDDRQLVSEVFKFLEGQSSDPLSSNYFRRYEGSCIPLREHIVDSRHLEILKALFETRRADQALNILLYGRAGSGKTEFARSLGKRFFKAVYEIRHLESPVTDRINGTLFRLRALMACQNMVGSQDALIVVDEADSLLNSGRIAFRFTAEKGGDKGFVNNILDHSGGTTIWIINQIGMDESTRRRFDYSIEFTGLSFEQRVRIWDNCLRKFNLAKWLGREEVEELAARYEVDAGGIELALRNYTRAAPRNKTRADFTAVVEGLIQAHLKLMGQEGRSGEGKMPDAMNYSIEGLNVAGLEQALQALEAFNSGWSASAREQEIRNANVLLYGAPGTGKSEFAKYLARRLNRRLVTKHASDLLSCWVGETEKLIKAAFKEAEKAGAILFIDEADGLLAVRQNAAQSWQVTQTNELLGRMETFRGMLICATNFLDGLDSAAMRRFTIKLRFDYLTPDGNLIFYHRLLYDLVAAPLSDSEIEAIKAMANLAPGDFRVVYQRHCLLERKGLTHRMLIEALVKETEAKRMRTGIGF